jgi:hypothetical protein
MQCIKQWYYVENVGFQHDERRYNMTLKELEKKVRYLTDYIAISQLQSKYQQYLFLCMHTEVRSLFAQKTPGVEIEIGSTGVYEGLDAPQRFWCHEKDGPSYPGFLVIHEAVNPVIEINKDGTRAKGLWWSPGLYTALVDGKLVPEWEYGRYIMEYVKEDGEWKILKCKWRRTFAATYEGKGWVEGPIIHQKYPGYRPRPEPDKPTTYDKPYVIDEAITFGPPPPDPYNE